MTAPVSPFTTSAAVAYFAKAMLKGNTDFDDVDTNPKKAVVDTFISMVSAQMEMQFSSAGYYIPLAEIAGETWPTAQTTYLNLVATLGSVAIVGGYSQRPLPAVGPGTSGSSGNVFQDLYNAELQKIYDPATRRTSLNFRANYRIGTPAQITLTDPKGPTSDFLEGRYDPQRYLGLVEVANQIMNIQALMGKSGLDWDYMYGLFGINKGYGLDGETYPWYTR